MTDINWFQLLKSPTVSAELYAALTGNSIIRWVVDKIPGDALVVLTDGPSGESPGIYYNLAEGEVIVLESTTMQLLTDGDDIKFDLGYTDQANGAGTYHPLIPPLYSSSGVAVVGFSGSQRFMAPPHGVVKYADGARSITIRVDANDNSAKITCSWYGYRWQ